MTRADRISSRIIAVLGTLGWSMTAPVLVESPRLAAAVTVLLLAVAAVGASVADLRREATR